MSKYGPVKSTEGTVESSRNRLKISSFAVSFSLLTLFGCSGAGTAQTTTTTITTTTVVLEKPFGAPLLIEALPSALELPSGWTASGKVEDSLGGSLDPRSGNGFGICGGPNRDQLLQQNGVVAWSSSQTLRPENGSHAWIYISEFPTAQAAKGFLEASASQASCESISYSATEIGEGVTVSKTSKAPRIDIFSGSDNSSKWKVSESYTVGGRLLSTPSLGMTRQTNIEYLLTRDGTSYGKAERTVVAYEQFMNLVIQFGMNGDCCVYGFTKSEARATDYRRSFSDLNAMAELFRPDLLRKLGVLSVADSVANTTVPANLPKN